MASRSDPWEPRQLPRCTGKHGPWVYYSSLKKRHCHTCDYEEPMYADFGVLPKDPTLPLADEQEVRRARALSVAVDGQGVSQ